MKLRTSLVVLAAACTLAGSGCGGNGEELLQLSRAAEIAVRPLSQPVVRESFDSIATSLAENRSWEETRQAIVDLYESTDTYESALASAVCAGMQQMANATDPNASATSDDWKSFLVDYMKAKVNSVGALYYVSKAQAKVGGLMTYWQLDQVSPATARTYWLVCQGRRS